MLYLGCVNTLGCLIQGGVLINGGGWEPLKETNKRGGVLINEEGSEIRKKRVFTLSTGDKRILRVHCNDFLF